MGLGETNYYRSKKRSRTRSVTLNQPALNLAPSWAGRRTVALSARPGRSRVDWQSAAWL